MSALGGWGEGALICYRTVTSSLPVSVTLGRTGLSRTNRVPHRIPHQG
jgi:hypothetical protein